MMRRAWVCVFARASACLLWTITSVMARPLALPYSELSGHASPLVRAEQRVDDFQIVAYHDIAVDGASRRALRDRHAVTLPMLLRHFSWLRDNDYRVVSMAQVIAARSGGAPLPPRAVALTFDDAYKSFHTHVLPLLELFDYSATLAVVGLWIEATDTESIPFGDEQLSRARFMTWLELRDVVASGRVEIASHSFDLHRGHVANPQRNIEPSATTLHYDAGSGSYETAANFATRIERDLRRNNDLLRERLGIVPRIMVWPYGAYTPGTQRIASALGLVVGLTLDNGNNQSETSLAALNRVLVQSDTAVPDLERALRPQRDRTERALEVDLDDVFDADNAVQEKKLGALLDRLQRLAPSSIYLNAISATRDAAGRPGAYFLSSVLPLRGDVFNRVAWQVRARLGINVYAWLPTGGLPASINDIALPTLFAEMLRSVPVAGVYFSESDAASDARINALRQTVSDERPRLRIARRFAAPIATGNDAAVVRAQWQQRTVGIDWTVLSPPNGRELVTASNTRIKDERGAWGVTTTTVAARRTVAQTLVDWSALGVMLDRVVWRATDDSSASQAAIAALQSAGARHFSYGELPRPQTPVADGLRLLLSTEGTPIAR